jgi:hypothetical protein
MLTYTAFLRPAAAGTAVATVAAAAVLGRMAANADAAVAISRNARRLIVLMMPSLAAAAYSVARSDSSPTTTAQGIESSAELPGSLASARRHVVTTRVAAGTIRRHTKERD